MAEKLIAETRRMQHQLVEGDVAFWGAQLRLAMGVKAVEHLNFGNVRHVFFRRIAELDLALLNQLHQRHAGDRLGAGEDAHDAVGRHGKVAVERAFASGAFVDITGLVGRHGDNARHPEIAMGLAVQNEISGLFE